jgi:NitT/TauT family transport system permease protein
MISRRLLAPSVFALLLLGGWEWAVRVYHPDSPFVPTPTAILAWFWEALLDGSLVEATLVTLRRLGLGFLIGALLGLAVGGLCARSRTVRDAIGWLTLGLQTLPSVCWVPMAILWFGQDEGAVIFVTVMGTVWSVVIAVQESVLSVQPLYIRAAQTMGSRGWHLWSKVLLPAALPGVVGGMKQGWAFAWRSLMAAEIFVVILSGFGLGSMLHAGRELLRMEQVVGVMAVVILVGLLADLILFGPVERWLRRSRGLGGG